MNRRTWLRMVLGAPIALSIPSFDAFAQNQRGKVKITDVKAMQISNIAGNCLIRIDTDSGLVGLR